MPCGWSQAKATSKSSLGRGLAILGAALLGSAIGAPSAFPAPLVEVPDVPGAAPSVPSLPQAPQPQVPPLPQVSPAPSQPQVEVPDRAAPAPLPSVPLASARSGGAPSPSSPGAGSTDGGSGSTGTVTSAGTAATPGETASGHGRSVPDLGPSGGHGAGTATHERGAVSIRAAVAAPLRRWIAYVWPAIALGPAADALAMSLVPRLAGLESVATRSLAALAASLSLSEASGASGAPAESAQAPEPNPPRAAPFHDFTPQGGGMSLFVTMITVLAALIGVVALARLTVGEDLFSTRWLH